MPKEKLNFIRTKNELLGFWDQSNISKLNIKRLNQLKDFQSEEIQKLVQLTLEVAAVKPHKRRRLKWLKQKRPELFHRVIAYFRGDLTEEENEEIFQEATCDSEYSEDEPIDWIWTDFTTDL